MRGVSENQSNIEVSIKLNDNIFDTKSDFIKEYVRLPLPGIQGNLDHLAEFSTSEYGKRAEEEKKKFFGDYDPENIRIDLPIEQNEKYFDEQKYKYFSPSVFSYKQKKEFNMSKAVQNPSISQDIEDDVFNSTLLSSISAGPPSSIQNVSEKFGVSDVRNLSISGDVVENAKKVADNLAAANIGVSITTVTNLTEEDELKLRSILGDLDALGEDHFIEPKEKDTHEEEGGAGNNKDFNINENEMNIIKQAGREMMEGFKNAFSLGSNNGLKFSKVVDPANVRQKEQLRNTDFYIPEENSQLPDSVSELEGLPFQFRTLFMSQDSNKSQFLTDSKIVDAINAAERITPDLMPSIRNNHQDIGKVKYLHSFESEKNTLKMKNPQWKDLDKEVVDNLDNPVLCKIEQLSKSVMIDIPSFMERVNIGNKYFILKPDSGNGVSPVDGIDSIIGEGLLESQENLIEKEESVESFDIDFYNNPLSGL